MSTLSQMDSKTLIETYFKYHAVQTNAAQTQANQAEMKSIRDSVGGDEAYREMIQWAGQNLMKLRSTSSMLWWVPITQQLSSMPSNLWLIAGKVLKVLKLLS